MGMFSFLGEPALTRNAGNQIVDKFAPERDPISFLFLHAEDAEKNLSAEIMSFSMFSSSRVFWVGTLEKSPPPLLDFLLFWETMITVAVTLGHDQIPRSPTRMYRKNG